MITANDYRRLGLNTFLANPGVYPVATTNAIPELGLYGITHFASMFRSHDCYRYYYAGYYQGRIIYTQMSSPTVPFAVSKKFSGCAMAYFVYRHVAYVAHIALEANYFDDRHKWNDFIIWNRRNITKYAIFRPAKSHVAYTNDVVGLITPQLDCYSILVNKVNYDPVTIRLCTPNEIHATNDLSRIVDITPFLIPAKTAGTSW